MGTVGSNPTPSVFLPLKHMAALNKQPPVHLFQNTAARNNRQHPSLPEVKKLGCSRKITGLRFGFIHIQRHNSY